tara:strand:+ start:432 stop:632 length:201 start_codon:yes stop_codon:yes gene_type:complete
MKYIEAVDVYHGDIVYYRQDGDMIRAFVTYSGATILAAKSTLNGKIYTHSRDKFYTKKIVVTKFHY